MTVEGIDISNNNPDQDYSQYAFTFLKATEGETFQDADYSARHAAVRNAGKIAGAYLFYRTASTPQAHAAFFHTVAAIQPGDIVALDFENDETWGQYSSQALAGMATQTMQLLLQMYPQNRVVLYCNLSTYNNVVVPYSVPLGDGLWIAEPSGTPTSDWVFWQYSSDTVDHDRANFDTFDRLHLWANTKGQISPGPITGTNLIEGNMGMGAWPAGTNQYHQLVFPCGPDNSGIVQAGWLSFATGGGGATADIHVWFTTTDNIDSNPTGRDLDSVDVSLEEGKRWYMRCPNNTDQIGVMIRSATNEVAWCLELLAK